MTSIAGFLASLAGGAPQEGQKATQANATGTIGLFSALISATGSTQATEGEVAGNSGPPGLTLHIPNAQTVQTASGDDVLGEALAEGLALTQGEVEAAIVEEPVSPEADNAGEVIPEIVSATPQEGTPEVTGIVGTTETTENAETAEEGSDGEGPAIPSPDSAVQADIPETQATDAVNIQADAPVSAQSAAPQAAAPAQTAQEATAQASQTGRPEKQAHPTGLENALTRASEKGQQNGLQNALSQAPRAGNGGEASQTATPESHPDASRPSVSDTTDKPAPVKSPQDRPQFAALETKPVQRVIDAGNGQTQIRIHNPAGGEITTATSPPTLTVNVPASAASPGPASPNTPHVPVSALAVHIAQQANNGAKRFDIRLDPPELGRVEVRLDVSREGHVTTHLVVERAETLDLLQRDARHLERMLQDAGLNTSEEGMKFSLKDQGQANGGDNPDGFEDVKVPAGEGDEDSDLTASDTAMPRPGRYLASGGIDIRI